MGARSARRQSTQSVRPLNGITSIGSVLIGSNRNLVSVSVNSTTLIKKDPVGIVLIERKPPFKLSSFAYTRGRMNLSV